MVWMIIICMVLQIDCMYNFINRLYVYIYMFMQITRETPTSWLVLAGEDVARAWVSMTVFLAANPCRHLPSPNNGKTCEDEMPSVLNGCTLWIAISVLK